MNLDDAVERLLVALPELREETVELTESWLGDPPATLLMATIGKGFVRRFDGVDDQARRGFFAAIEVGLADRDPLIAGAVATGLLEALISEIERSAVDRSRVFDRGAGPLAREYVRNWDLFCGV